MDVDGLERVMRDVKPIELEKLRASRPKFWVGVTDLKTGMGRFFETKSFADPLQVVAASMCFPVLSGSKRVIDETDYIDGGLANALPLSFAIEKLDATDILVLMTSPIVPKRRRELLHTILDKTLYSRFSKGLRESIASYEARYNKELAFLTGQRQLPDLVYMLPYTQVSCQ